MKEATWVQNVIKEAEYDHYMIGGKDFIDDDKIWEKIEKNKSPEPARIRSIIQKSFNLELLSPDETAALLNVKDPHLWDEIFDAAGKIKRKVYDNRIVTFAPLYCSNFCVNNCLYCGFRSDNKDEKRLKLTLDDVRRETEVLAGKIGHKRLIVVYGEHPVSDVNYMADTIRTIYDVKVKARKGIGEIRRVNVNAAPMSVEDLRILKDVGVGTYQVFQETYHHKTYSEVHPAGTLKANYQWRLYSMHRALEAGIDDVAIGALFGLYDWKFEVMGLLYHAIELEKQFGIGPHTVSFPRLEEAQNVAFDTLKYKVSDEDFKKLVAVLRLSIPYTGMILTAREPARVRREVLPIGITQTDASTKIGIGAYSEIYGADKMSEKADQDLGKQQFMIGDPRDLDDVVRELAQMGYITSFCTAGYRCGRTGTNIMTLLKTEKEGQFCKLNAILTFREWLDDFASDETKKIGEELIKKEMAEVKSRMPKIYSEKTVSKLENYHERIKNGERDLYF